MVCVIYIICCDPGGGGKGSVPCTDGVAVVSPVCTVVGGSAWVGWMRYDTMVGFVTHIFFCNCLHIFLDFTKTKK